MVRKSQVAKWLVNKKWWIAALILTLGVCISIAIYILYIRPPIAQEHNNSPDYASLSHNIASDSKKKSTTEIISDYSSHYEAAMKDLYRSSPGKWNKDMVDQAHLCLLYADKMGLTSQVISLYRSIASAKAQGVNVDDNSAGITQEDRQQIYKRNGGN